jgi:hypothetical protein
LRTQQSAYESVLSEAVSTADKWYHQSLPDFSSSSTAVTTTNTTTSAIEANTTTTRRTPPPPPAKNSSHYAYAFIIGGCNPEEPRYRGFVYNVAVVARILREEGSTADVVAFFQMSVGSDATALPDEDASLLEALGVRVLYLPKSELESFYETVLNKFCILGLTEYRRVLLLDGDVMPVANLDYLFALSDSGGVLKENVVVSGPWEPANGGFFMLAPGPNELDTINDIIRKREENAMTHVENGLEGHKFDVVKGWGHRIEPPDEWISRKERGINWTFHFAFSDQGLLYHYVKYVKKTVSIIGSGNRVENWGAAANGTVILEETLDDPFRPYSTKRRITQHGACLKFMCDYIHFSGTGKPWLSRPPSDIASDERRNADPRHIWWHTLYELNEELGLHLNFSDWKTGQRPALGLYAKYGDMDRRVDVRTNSQTRPKL